jgi:hypothetical protein
VSRLDRTNFTSASLFILTVAVALAVGAVASQLRFTMLALTVIGIGVHVLLLVAARRLAGRTLSIVFLVTALWMVYFPVRLLVIQGDRHHFTLHPVVAHASDSDLLWIWVISALGLGSLLLGSRLARGRPQRVVLNLPGATRGTFAMLAATGLLLTIGMQLSHLTTGLLAQTRLVSLFGLAGLGFFDGQKGRPRLQTMALVGLAVLLGSRESFKELAVLPLAAWMIGIGAGAQFQLRARHVLAGVLLALIAFLGVDGQRIADRTGDQVGLATGAVRAVTQYDLRTGYPKPHGKHGTELFTNVAYGVSRRFYGADALLVLRHRVPATLEFQRGRTIVDPALSVIPGITHLVELKYPQLSLGGFFTRLYSLNPNSDRSSQTLTWPGDLYLNFGTGGILVGLLLIGVLLSRFDRLIDARSAFGCSLFAYVGTGLLALERNVAYAFVTSAMRMMVVLVVLLIVGEITRRSMSQKGVHVAATVGEPFGDRSGRRSKTPGDPASTMAGRLGA